MFREMKKVCSNQTPNMSSSSNNRSLWPILWLVLVESAFNVMNAINATYGKTKQSNKTPTKVKAMLTHPGELF